MGHNSLIQRHRPQSLTLVSGEGCYRRQMGYDKPNNTKGAKDIPETDFRETMGTLLKVPSKKRMESWSLLDKEVTEEYYKTKKEANDADIKGRSNRQDLGVCPSCPYNLRLLIPQQF